jgi:threonine/homoserine/homoserine lactone efflux protein
MPDNILLFALAALVMALTPGPNMVYLISRSICQGKAAVKCKDMEKCLS